MFLLSVTHIYRSYFGIQLYPIFLALVILKLGFLHKPPS